MAISSDGSCAAGPRQGEYIWLDLTDAQINALSNPPFYAWSKLLLHEMHDYGLLIVDTSGSGATPWDFDGLDNATYPRLGIVAGWTSFFNAVISQEGGSGNLNYSNNASHLAVPTTGITAANIHIVCLFNC
jgi:hypothetical protein